MGIAMSGGISQAGIGILINSPVGFSVSATEFDGSDDHLLHTGALTVSDEKTGTVSLWFKRGSADASERFINIDGTLHNSYFDVDINGSNVIQVVGRTSANSLIMNIQGTTVFNSVTGNWVHMMASWDLTDINKRNLYIDNVDDSPFGTYTDGIINYNEPDNDTNVAIGANAAGNSFWDGCLAEVWFSTVWLDLSQASVREKFILDGKPVDLTEGGDAGALPTGGTAPILYFSGDSASFSTNLGTGGSFAVQGGGLTNCADSPSD